MIDILLDSNILIYISSGNTSIAQFVKEKTKGKRVGISIVTYIEVLVGAKSTKEERALLHSLSQCILVTIDKTIAQNAAQFLRTKRPRGIRNPHFADVVIAQTALQCNASLMTNNPSDFRVFKQLKLITPS